MSTDNAGSRFVVEGVLSSGNKFGILPSRKKAPGLESGDHFAAILIKEDGVEDETSIDALDPRVVGELLFESQKFAKERAHSLGKYRIAYNGSTLGIRSHTHIHIILPKGDDELPRLVAG